MPIKHLPKIEAKVILHRKQRYNTAGDWFDRKGSWQFRVSRMKGKDAAEIEFKILMHELFERYLCWKNGISVKDVDKWDFAFEGRGEPGDAVKCPYRREHRAASRLDRFIDKELRAILPTSAKRRG